MPGTVVHFDLCCGSARQVKREMATPPSCASSERCQARGNVQTVSRVWPGIAGYGRVPQAHQRGEPVMTRETTVHAMEAPDVICLPLIVP